MLVSRLVEKAPQLIGNLTTNLAEAWMHIRCKFDGGKVINRSQSGSWQYRCMGAGLQQNLGKTWGPQVWEEMTKTKANQIFIDVSQSFSDKTAKDRKRKATERAKQNRRKSKYTRTDNSQKARRAYTRHDGSTSPDEVVEEVSPEYLSELKSGYYQTKVKATEDEVKSIEKDTQEQHSSSLWYNERKKRITASVAGSISKMKKTTKRGKKVETLLYSTFKGSRATRYGTEMEKEARKDYIAYQIRRGHNVRTVKTGLVISIENPWLAASPDDRVFDQESSPQLGLVEYKNPYAARNMTIADACEKIRSFCLEKKGKVYQLRRGHDYYYQVQCQLYCDNKWWCDFVLRTEKELFVERISRDTQWWDKQLPRLREFYFEALLPELACPRYNKGGIRD